MSDHGKEPRRERERDDRRERSRERERDRDERRDRDRKRRSRSRSRDKDRRSRRSRSRSRERAPRRERKTGFDKGPTGEIAAPVPLAQLPGAFPGMMPGMPPGMPGMPGMPFAAQPPAGAMTQQATRHARRIYIGGLPPTVEEQPLAVLFNQAMHTIGGVVGAGDSVVNVYINTEKKFAFVEFRSVEECSNAMALDGILYDGVPIRVRRPNDYNPVVAASLGPSQPSGLLKLNALGLAPGGGAADGPDRVFVGGLPYYLNEPQVRELLEAFGPLRALDMIRDKDTGNSKGYAFCVYADPAVTDMACAGLNGMAMGDKTLTVRRASAMGQPKVGEAPLTAAQQAVAMQMMAGGGLPPGMDIAAAMLAAGVVPGPAPTHVVVLDNVVSADELRDDAEFAEIEEDMRDECGKFGEVLALRIPRPAADAGAAAPAGVGRVYVRYAQLDQSARARAALHGRKFGGNAVVAEYFDEARFEAGEL